MEESEVTINGAFQCITAFIFIAFSATAAVTNDINYKLPNLGEPSSIIFSSAEEKQLGKTFIRDLRHYVDVINDPILNNYIQQLGYSLVAYCDNPSQHFYFFVVRSPEINAFTGPNGYIGVNSGLLLYTMNEAELASVLAHEITHVTQHHLARTFSTLRHAQLSGLAAIIGAIATGNPALAAGVITTTMAGSAQAYVNHSREHEQEADRIGITLLQRAGYDSQAMARLFNRMYKQSEIEHDKHIDYINTHPFYDTRIADAQGRSSVPQQKNPHQTSLKFLLIRMRLLVNTKYDAASSLKEFDAALKKSPHNPVLQYGYALTLAKKQAYAKALMLLSALTRHYPDNFIYQYTLAEIENKAGHYNQALHILKALHAFYPDNYAVIMLYSYSLLLNNKNQPAYCLLQSYLPLYKHDFQYLTLYAKTLATLNNLIQAYQMQALAYEQEEYYQAALALLKIAQQQPYQSADTRTDIEEHIKHLQQLVIK